MVEEVNAAGSLLLLQECVVDCLLTLLSIYVFHGINYPKYVFCMSTGPYTLQSLLPGLCLISVISCHVILRFSYHM